MTQAAVIAFLADPASHGGTAVDRIDTHISSVFLAGERVLKLKKAVRLPFLDFSTLEARRLACLSEVEVNRDAACGLYLGVRAVTAAPDGRLALDGEGAVVDWVVEMRRFDQDSLFDRQVRDGRLDRAGVNALIEAVAAFHHKAPHRPDKGGAAGLVWTIDTNRSSMLPHLPRDKVDRLSEASHAWLARLGPVLDRRRAEGFVRRCHGDLHLGNICLFQGRPTLFDAIEFSEDIACVDVFYDLAFLLMDLDCRGARPLASYALNHYLDLGGDFEGVEALPLFLSARAGVRAHVSATIAAGAEGELRRQRQAEALSYLDAALAYLSPPPARLLAVGGLSGSGKSRMGRELAPFLGVPGAVVVRSDALRKHLMGVPILDKLGPEGYAPEVGERTYQALYDTCSRLLAMGHPVVADAVFARPDQRDAIEAVARRAGVPFDGLWLEAPPELSAERIAKRRANVSDATPAVLEQQRGYDLGEIGWRRINTGGPKDEVLAAGRAAIGV